jgi:hypothetical protein
MSKQLSNQSILESYGFTIKYVCWEDTARSKGSIYGPNISDMTLRSNGVDCPVIRRSNFADVTVDHSPDNFYVTKGNEKGNKLNCTTLREYLAGLNITLDPSEKVLCSTQACILQDNKTSIFDTAQTALDRSPKDIPFNVRLYNYQTTTANPAVLVIISTNQGTSAQILNANTTDILFNKNGRAHDFIAERLQEERVRLGKSVDEPMSSEEKERNVVFIYQIPLVIPRTSYHGLGSSSKSFMTDGCDIGTPILKTQGLPSRCLSRGFDNAMLRVSANDKGVFTGTQGKVLIRDTNYPIRCTLQYYWVTDDMTLTEPLVQTIAQQLEKFYTNSENKSSLVVGQTSRSTEPKNLPSTPSFPNPQFRTSMNAYM